MRRDTLGRSSRPHATPERPAGCGRALPTRGTRRQQHADPDRRPGTPSPTRSGLRCGACGPT
eukprot:418403-Rhodomonas_salina.1